MLKHWDSHAEYQHFISQAVESLNPSQLKKFSSMSDSLNKLTSMNLEIYAGDDGETWNLIGKYFFDGSIKTEQMVPVKACDARWIRLYIPTLGSGSSVGHLAEIYVYGTDK